MRNQAAGATRLPTCPIDLSLAAIRSADARSATGPTRTRYRTALPDPPGNTNTEKPCPFTWRVKLSAFTRLAKLPSCTDHEPCPFDVGEGAADSTGVDRVGAGFAKDFADALLADAGDEAAAPDEAGLGAAGVSPAGAFAADKFEDAELAAVAADAAPGSPSALAGALLVVRSSVTFRTGSGAAAGRVGAVAAFGFGPDSNSGTTSTTSATRIDAPISRSLTRRSITLKYIRDAPRPAVILVTRASPSPAPRYERIRTRRCDPAAPRLAKLRRRPPRRRPRRRRVPAPLLAPRRPTPARCDRACRRPRRTTKSRCSGRALRRLPPRPCPPEFRIPPMSCPR